MSARSVVERALTDYFKDSEDPAGMARKVLHAYRAALYRDAADEVNDPGSGNHLRRMADEAQQTEKGSKA